MTKMMISYRYLILLFAGLLFSACDRATEVADVEEPAEAARAPAEAVAGDNEAFSMLIMDVFKITGKGVVMTGRVASGVVSVNDTVCVPLTSGEVVAMTVDGIEQFRKLLDQASAGENVGILVAGLQASEIEKGAKLNKDC